MLKTPVIAGIKIRSAVPLSPPVEVSKETLKIKRGCPKRAASLIIYLSIKYN